MGSLAKLSAVAQCSVSDGLSVEEPYVDFTHFVRPMTNPDGVSEKSVPLMVSSIEMMGIGLGLTQSKAHLDYNLARCP